jgi:SAM-dependent methyltransferase
VSVDAASYDAWYETPRGRWIGRREAERVVASLQPRPGESLLDVGCGTGYFTRALERAVDGRVVGADIDPEWVAYARNRDTGRASYEVADACTLPYANASFDLVVSITALWFPSGGVFARVTERAAPPALPGGASILVVGDVAPPA